jgi:hypothetical protein
VTSTEAKTAVAASATASGSGAFVKKEANMPKILDKAVQKIKAQSPGVNPYAVATASLQKAGDLKPGTNKATAKGVARGQMTSAQREKSRDRL